VLSAMNPLKIGFWKPMLHNCFIKLFPHKLLSFGVFRLHITNHYGQHFTIDKIIHTTNHSCSANNTLHMIKHNLQIPYGLHSCDKANSSPNTIYRHLENKDLFSMNLFWEATLLDVVIPTIGLQFKDVINIATSWMTLKRSNKVTNVGRTKFTQLVLDVL